MKGLFIFFLVVLLCQCSKTRADEWCEGYILTGEPADFAGYMVGLKEDGSEFVYRRTTQGYQLFAGEGPNTIDPRMCIEINIRKGDDDE